MDPMKSALNLFRRLPPEEVESTFRSIALLREDLSSELLQHLEFPLTKGYDEESKKEFILSDFNSNGESYR
jgi:F-actin-capping protein subunit beta